MGRQELIIACGTLFAVIQRPTGGLVKRAFDVVVASLMILLLSPLLAMLWVAVRIKLGSPVLFSQERPGLGGKPFTLYKFRTMLEGDDADELRLTRFGKALRASSLDELPELINVLRGEMSLVGPRPLLVKYLDLYTEEQARRHEARPGITGLAQVNGRNATDWSTRLSHDVWYVDNWSLGLDVKILFLTVGKVFARHGVSAEGHATMPEFKGEA